MMFAADELTGEVRDLCRGWAFAGEKKEKLSDAFTKLKAEHQVVTNELARLKKRPPRER
jgi:hypothetical protein